MNTLRLPWTALRRTPDAEIERICRYLEEHYAEPVTLDGLSAMANRSKYYFLLPFYQGERDFPITGI